MPVPSIRHGWLPDDCVCYFTDIDECAEANPCGEGGNCINTVGAYGCDCHDGYMLRLRRTGWECEGKSTIVL